MAKASIPQRYVPAGSVAVRDKTSSAVAYIRNDAKAFYAIMYSGRRGRADGNYRFQTAAAREAHVTRHFESVRANEGYRAKRDADRKAIAAGVRSGDYAGKDHFSAAETATLIRRALVESFPGVKFGVRTDHNSVRVTWTDGPAAEDVKRVAEAFQGGYFDGMTDYAGSYYHLFDGRKVSFGAKYVFCDRSMTADALRTGLDAMRADCSGNADGVRVDVSTTQWGESVRVICEGDHYDRHNPQLVAPHNDGRAFVRAELSLERWFDGVRPVAVAKSRTLARVQFLGSDYRYYSGVQTAADALAKLDGASPTAH